jgi:NADH-quinone oxidoreductase subunit J
MFVIMLATLPETPGQPETAASYDRTSREPLLAVIMGFVLLGALGSVFFGPPGTDQDRRGEIARAHAVTPWSTAANVTGKVDPQRVADRRQLEAQLRDRGQVEANEYVHQVDLAEGRVGVRPGASFEDSIGSRTRWVEMDSELLREFVGNIDHVGLNLFEAHTLGIELAGVILLLAMVGAIVIARQRIPGAMEPAEGTRS